MCIGTKKCSSTGIVFTVMKFLLLEIYCIWLFLFQPLQEVTRPHIDSFNHMLFEGLRLAVQVSLSYHRINAVCKSNKKQCSHTYHRTNTTFPSCYVKAEIFLFCSHMLQSLNKKIRHIFVHNQCHIWCIPIMLLACSLDCHLNNFGFEDVVLSLQNIVPVQFAIDKQRVSLYVSQAFIAQPCIPEGTRDATKLKVYPAEVNTELNTAINSGVNIGVNDIVNVAVDSSV